MSAIKQPLFTRKPWWAALALACAIGGSAQAGPVLIVRSDIGAVDNPTLQAVTKLSALQIAAGNTVTVVTSMPTALAGYSQVWDLAFRGGSLSAESQSAYLGYLQQGGRLTLIGENDSIFGSRNQGIRDFIALAGGGAVGAQSAAGSLMQTVRAPFVTPELSSPFPLLAAAYFDNRGSGDWLIASQDDDLGSGLAFDVGDLANAGGGTLLSVLDVDFLGNLNQGYGTQTQALAASLVNYMNNGAVSQVPEPPALALAGLALAAAALGTRRRAGFTSGA